MGKQGRRKQRQRRKQQQQPLATETASTNTAHSSSSAVNKLRHADPKVRHAALIALQATAFQPSKQQRQQVVALPVLQAVREQVMDNDLECAAVASECLVLYLQQQHQSDESTPHNKSTQQREEATSSWVTVLLGRLEQCCQHLQEAQSAEAEPLNTTAKKRIKAWLAVAAPCSHALCLLIERNGSALEQILLQRQKFCQVLFGLLQSVRSVEAVEDSTAAAVYAARSLHSALDENSELSETMILGYLNNNNVWRQWLEETSDKSTMVQLHLIGSLVNMYQLVEEGRSEHKLLEDMLMTHGIVSSPSSTATAAGAVAVSPTPSIPVRPDGLLTRTLKAIDYDQLKSLECEFRSAQELFESQQHDAQMEEDIIQKVNDRKEPARDIARRQKKLQEVEEQARKKRAEELGDVDMKDVEEKETSSRGKFTKHEKNGEQAMDEAMTLWNGKIQPLQLALEILANLFTCWIPRDDDMMDDSAMTVTQQSPLRQALQTQQKGPELVLLVQQLCRLNNEIQKDIPMREDLDESIAKACACMSNCLLSETLEEAEIPLMWGSFCEQVRLLGQNMGDSSQTPLESLLGTMAILVQRQPHVVRHGDLELFHDLLFRSCSSDSMRGAVSIISVAVAQSSPSISLTEPAVRKLTKGFLQLLSNNKLHHAISLEILNAFMDWFGQDEFYPQTFDDLNVLSSIEQSLHKFKDSSLSFTPEEEEILYNTEQFVEYKRNQ
jgi:hypothetical protein